MHSPRRKGPHLEVDAGDLGAAILLVTARALAKLREPGVSIMTKFHPGSDQHAVDFNTSSPFEFKKHVDYAGVVGTLT